MTGIRQPLRYGADGGVANLILDRPEKRNALDQRLIQSLKEALRRAEADDAVRVITISGAGPDFCAGLDLRELSDAMDAPILESARDARDLADLFLLPRQLRKPVIAIVQGRAVAGGCGLATACDVVLAAESATFGYPETRLGFVPALVTGLLRRNVTEKRAFELIVGGGMVTAHEAERYGLVNHVYPDASFAAEGAHYAARFATLSPTAVGLTKRVLYQQDGLSFEAALQVGADVNVIARLTNEAREGVRGFLQRRSRESAKGD